MKKITLLLALVTASIACISQVDQPNPFESIGKEAKILTLSNGKYQEVFRNDTLKRMGNVVYNTITKEIAYIVEDSVIMSEDGMDVHVVSRWLSRDPLAKEYPSMSPYNFTGNNPIMFIDTDGRVIVDPKTGQPVKQVNGEWKTVTINEDGTETYGDVSKKFIEKSLPILNSLSSSEVGKQTIEKMQDISTEIRLVKHKTSGSAFSHVTPPNSWVISNPELYLNDKGEQYEATIKPYFITIQEGADAFGYEFDELLVAVMQVEIGHLDAEQKKVEMATGGDISWNYMTYKAKKDVYEPLFNDFVSAVIQYRKEKGIEITEEAFKMVLDQSDLGFKLNEANQKEYDEMKARSKESSGETPIEKEGK